MADAAPRAGWVLLIVVAACSGSSGSGSGGGAGGGGGGGAQQTSDGSTVGSGALPVPSGGTLTGTPPTGHAEASKGEGSAPADTVAFSGSFPKGMAGFGTTTLTVAGAARSVGFYVPPNLPAHPALVVAFHGTGSNPRDFLDESGFTGVADTHGFVVALPQAVANRLGGPGDPDHWDAMMYATGWNLSEPSPDANDDLQLVRAILSASRTAWSINSDRVYTAGHSNGAFFSWFAASALNGRIAAFAENAGGAIACANRGSDGPGGQFTGTATTCAALKQAPGYPTCTGALRPGPPATGRIPPGYLAHHHDDDVVSVAWTCSLADALGPRGVTGVFTATTDSRGHSVTRGFAETAWSFVSRYTRSD